MKLPAFEYAAPATLDDAVSLLAGARGRAKLIAGGQSLMPAMAFRLATPELLVDLRRVPDLDRISIGDEGIRLGGKVRWRDLLEHTQLRAVHPLLVAAVSHVAHYQIRNRGTVGGSLAHADPASEMPAVAVTCDAQLTLRGPSGSRTVQVRDFFLGPLTTVLADDEILTEVWLPPWPPRRKWGFQEFARRQGDFALAGVAAFYDQDPSGRATNAHIGVLGACHKPHRIAAAESALNGRALDDATIQDACRAAGEAVDPPEDLHASAAYRRSLVETLLERALRMEH